MCAAKIPPPLAHETFPVGQSKGKKSNPLNGRKVNEQRKKELSYLAKFWEAVKNFFKTLFCCGCCCSRKRNVSPKTKEQENPILPKPQSGVPAPPNPDPTSENDNPPPEHTKPAPTNEQPASSAPANESDAPQEVTQSKKAEPPKEPEPSKKPEQLEPPLFAPLAALKQKRTIEVCYTPNFKREATLLETHATFPYLVEFKKTLPKPKVPPLRAAAIAFKENSKQQLADYINDLANNLQHPPQLEQIEKFFKKRLAKINALLGDPIKTEDFDHQFKTLKEIAATWQTLWDIAQKPDLQKTECDLLLECSKKLPDASNAFYNDYPGIKERIKEQCKKIATLPLISSDRKKHIELSQHFSNKLGIQFRLFDPVQQHAQEFSDALFRDFLSLFQPPKENEEGQIPSFEPFHVQQILDYVEEELDTYNLAQLGLQSEHPDIQIEKIDAPALCAKIALEIAPLTQAWTLFKEMLTTKDIDQKIAILQQATKLLPENDSTLWIKYPIFKEVINKELLPLTRNHNSFSDHKFVTINPKDQQRANDINSAFEQLKTKLGMGINKKIEILKEAASFLPDKNSETWRDAIELQKAINDLYLPLIFDNFAGHSFASQEDLFKQEEINQVFDTLFTRLGCVRLQIPINPEHTIDEKIALIKTIAQCLPGKESEIWTKQPKLKECLIKALVPLAFESFRGYHFEVIKTDLNTRQFDADKSRRNTINSAFKKIAEKIECEQLQIKILKIVMDTSQDAQDAHDAAQNDAAHEARTIYTHYQQNVNSFGAVHALDFAVDELMHTTQTQDARTRTATLIEILSSMSNIDIVFSGQLQSKLENVLFD